MKNIFPSLIVVGCLLIPRITSGQSLSGNNTWTGINIFTQPVTAEALNTDPQVGSASGNFPTIDAALSSSLCAANGCRIKLSSGNIPCPITTITTPIMIEGSGPGGLNSTTNFDSFSGPSTLTNSSATANCITIGLPASNALAGVTLRNFQINGNKLVAGASSGDGIALQGGNSGSTTTTRDIHIDNILVRDAKGCGLNITGNVFITSISNSQFMQNAGTGGICLGKNGTANPGQLMLSAVGSDLNAGDGLNINSGSDIHVYRSTFADSGGNGVNVTTPGGNSAQFTCDGCNFEANVNAGVLIKDGAGHRIDNSNFPAGGRQLYGVYLDPPAGAPFTNLQLSMSNNTFGLNLTKDINLTANTHQATIWPQQLSSSVNYTFNDASGNACLIDYAIGGLKFTHCKIITGP